MATLNLGMVRGADGVGIPSGGTAGQVLGKLSDADNDTAWLNNATLLWSGQWYSGSITLDVDPSAFKFIVFAVRWGRQLTLALGKISSFTVEYASLDTKADTGVSTMRTYVWYITRDGLTMNIEMSAVYPNFSTASAQIGTTAAYPITTIHGIC